MPSAFDRNLQQAAGHCAGSVRRLRLDMRSRALGRPPILWIEMDPKIPRGRRAALESDQRGKASGLKANKKRHGANPVVPPAG